MALMTHAKFHFNRLRVTLIPDIRAFEPPLAWRTTEKAGPDRVKKRRSEAKLQNFMKIQSKIYERKLFVCYRLPPFVFMAIQI